MKTLVSARVWLGSSVLALLFLTGAGSTAATVAVTTPQGAPVAGATAAPEVRLSPGAEEVLKLTQAGVEEDVVREFVRNSPNAYNLSVGEIIRLKELGVSQAVITTMLVRGGELRASTEGRTTQRAPEPQPQAPERITPEPEAGAYPAETYTYPATYAAPYAYPYYYSYYPYSYSYWWYNCWYPFFSCSFWAGYGYCGTYPWHHWNYCYNGAPYNHHHDGDHHGHDGHNGHDGHGGHSGHNTAFAQTNPSHGSSWNRNSVASASHGSTFNRSTAYSPTQGATHNRSSSFTPSQSAQNNRSSSFAPSQSAQNNRSSSFAPSQSSQYNRSGAYSPTRATQYNRSAPYAPAQSSSFNRSSTFAPSQSSQFNRSVPTRSYSGGASMRSGFSSPMAMNASRPSYSSGGRGFAGGGMSAPRSGGFSGGGMSAPRGGGFSGGGMSHGGGFGGGGGGRGHR